MPSLKNLKYHLELNAEIPVGDLPKYEELEHAIYELPTFDKLRLCPTCNGKALHHTLEPKIQKLFDLTQEWLLNEQALDQINTQFQERRDAIRRKYDRIKKGEK